ncbi:MAG: tetratricopeptide repeat protein [Candidatus Acidiferrales bacterium]
MKPSTAIFALFLIVSPFPSVASQQSQPSQPDKKQLQAKAKELVDQGKALEQQGKLAEAKDKYVDAEGVMSTGDALSGIHRIDDEQQTQAQSIVADAHRLFDAGKFADSILQLQKALEIEPSDAAVHFDLALCYVKTGDRASAASNLDFAIAALPNQKERADLLAMRSTILMGTPAPDASGQAKNSLAGFNASYLQEDRDPADATKAEEGLCDQAKELQAAFPTNAAVIFNSAKCADEDARPGDAAHQLAAYLKAAPDALDRADAQTQQEAMTSLAGLTGDTGQSVRQHYATAARYLDYRHYDRAISEYQAAEQALPNYAPTEWQLGILYESMGDVAKARQHLQLYGQLETDAARKSQADMHLASLDNRRSVYDGNVEDAQDILTALFVHAMGIDTEGAKHKAKLSHKEKKHASSRYQEATRATGKLSEPYVERQLSLAQADVEAATEIFPLGAEANELLALIQLQANNWSGAYGSYDAIASQGFPVSFYAQVTSQHANKVVRAAKVEIGSDSVRLVYLSSYNEKKQISEAPDKPAGDDNLGNLVVSSDEPPDADAEALTIHPADLKGVSTNNNFVQLKLQTDQIYISPLDMLADAPFKGGAARSFGNEYTRMFIRYLGYADTKLGRGGMTSGEKGKLGFEISESGMTEGATVGMMGMGAPTSYGSAARSAQLNHALDVYISVNTGTPTASQSQGVADSMRAGITAIEQATDDDQRVLDGMEFKVIPTQAVALKFRDKMS